MNFKKLIIVTLIFIASVLFSACQSDDSKNLDAPAADLNGEWDVNETVHSECGEGIVYTNTYSITIQQTGNSIKAGIGASTVNGTIAGNKVTWNGTFPEENGSTKINFSGTVSADGNTITGTAPWTWTNSAGSNSCNGTTGVTAQRNQPLAVYEQNPYVIMIGDSYFAFNEYVSDELQRLSQKSYRHYYENGTGFNIPDGTPIGQQYENAKSESSEIRTVIMNGGGNDILKNSDCFLYGISNSDCKNCVDEMINSAELLVNEMNSDSVQNIIYLYYPDLTGLYEDLNPIIEYGYQKLSERITAANVYFINPKEEFAGHPEYFLPYDFHPSEAGGDVLAGLIWDVMVENDLER